MTHSRQRQRLMAKHFKKSKHAPVYDPNMTEEERLEANIQRKTRLIKQIKHDLIIKIVGFFLILFITFTFIFGVTLAPSNDMFPAIHEGDLLIYFRLGRMDNKEIALYKTPTGTNIGRIQALEGSEIGITDGGLLTQTEVYQQEKQTVQSDEQTGIQHTGLGQVEEQQDQQEDIDGQLDAFREFFIKLSVKISVIIVQKQDIDHDIGHNRKQQELHIARYLYLVVNTLHSEQ